MRQKIFYFFLIFLILGAIDSILLPQTAKTETERFYKPGSPRGLVSGGGQLKPQGKNVLMAIMIDPRVVWLRIEQNDYAVPQVGRNPNIIFYNGNPNVTRVPSMNCTRVKSLRFTVRVSGSRRVDRAVRFQWVGRR